MPQARTRFRGIERITVLGTEYKDARHYGRVVIDMGDGPPNRPRTWVGERNSGHLGSTFLWGLQLERLVRWGEKTWDNRAKIERAIQTSAYALGPGKKRQGTIEVGDGPTDFEQVAPEQNLLVGGTASLAVAPLRALYPR